MVESNIHSMENINTICENLDRAFTEQLDDPVTLATIVDMYIVEVNDVGSMEDKEQFLRHLLNLLKDSPKTVAEIGWDLPRELLKFYKKSNMDVDAKLASNPLVSLVMQCFNEVALSANPKECLLAGCEILSELDVVQIKEDLSQDDDDEEGRKKDDADYNENKDEDECPHRDPVEFFLYLKSYVLFELVQTALKRIKSLYPSKFLGMVVSAINRFIRNNISEVYNTVFMLRRVYAFCKSYKFPEISEELLEDIDLDKKESDKIIEDESILQKQLLRSLCTFTISECLKNKPCRVDVAYFDQLRNIEYNFTESDQEYLVVLTKFYQLISLIGIDIKEQFSNLLEETRNIYKALPPDSGISNDEAKRAISQVVYQLSYTYQLQKLTELKQLELNPDGILILSTMHYHETHEHLYSKINVKDSVLLYIRCTTLSLFSDTYNNQYAEGSARYWLWVAITNNDISTLKLGFSELPSYIRIVLLQMILMKSCNQPNEKIRMVSFTLLTRIMCLMPEHTSFEFVLDTLLLCPFTHAKIAVLGILKDLMLRNRQNKPNLEGQIADVNFESKGSPKKDGSSLSPSSSKLLSPKAYIDINEDRMASIHSVAMMVIQNEEIKDKDEYILILDFLNFFNGVSQKWDKDLLRIIHKEVAVRYNENTKEDIPVIGFIKIANETLDRHL